MTAKEYYIPVVWNKNLKNKMCISLKILKLLYCNSIIIKVIN